LLFATSLAAAGLTLNFLAVAQAYELPFDPVSCKHDPQGNFYVALGRYVFAFPYVERDNFVYDRLRPGNIGLKPPDPTDAVGCFGNPLQSWSHAFAYSYHQMMAGKNAPPTAHKPAPGILTLYRLGRSIPEPSDEDWPGESLALELNERGCQHAAVREELANGLIACRIRMINPPDVPEVAWAADYKARPEIYKTPLGKPFVIGCGSFLITSTISSCDVTYTMKPGLGLSYKFQPFIGANAIPIEQIIDFDKSLRAEIEVYLIKDYPWPEHGSAGFQVIEKSR